MEKNSQDILNEAKKRFKQIMEYTTVRPKFVDEAGDQNQEDPMQTDPNAAPQDPTQAGEDGNMPPIGGDAPAPQDPTQMGEDPQGQEMDMAPQGQDTGMDDGAAQGPEGFNPQVPQDDMSGMDTMPTDGVQPDDEVIDISDLTDSQEETQEDIESIDGKFAEALKQLNSLQSLIKTNDQKINNLKAEIEKRNPTQIEKLSMQTAHSYPFNVTPESFWDEKEKTSNYRTEDDNNGKEQGQYTITKKDLDGAVDWKGIADSLDDFDIMHQTMRNTTGLPI